MGVTRTTRRGWPSSWGKGLAWCSTLALSLAMAGWSLVCWERVRDLDQGLLSVPPLNAVKFMSCGYSNLLADVFYLRFTTYWGYWLAHGRKFHNLYPLLELVTELDPDFQPAYEVGSLALADSGQLDKTADLLAKGASHHPGDYWYPYQTGLMLFLYGTDFVLAGKYFELARSCPNAPPEAGFFAARMYQESHKANLAIATWLDIYNKSADKSVRAVAARALKRFGVDVSK